MHAEFLFMDIILTLRVKNLADHSRLQRLHTVCSGLCTTKVAGVLHILLVDPEVMFQVLPPDCLRWLDSLHLHSNMYDQLTASTVYVHIRKRKEKKKKRKEKEKKRLDYAFRRQFNEKPSIIPGCPGMFT